MPVSLSSRTVTIDDLNNFRWPLNLTENAIRVPPTFATVIALAVALAIGTFLTILFVLLTGGPGEDPNAKMDENGYGPGIAYFDHPSPRKGHFNLECANSCKNSQSEAITLIVFERKFVIATQ